MKYVFVILSGAADRPLDALEQKTPLMAAAGEHLTELRRRGTVGIVRSLPEEWEGSPEAALVNLAGADPKGLFTGAGAMDAAAAEVELDRSDLAFRLSLVSVDDGRLTNASAGRLPGDEARELVRYVQSKLRARWIEMYPTPGAEQLLVWRQAPTSIHCMPPARAEGRPIAEAAPQGDRSEALLALLWDTAEILDGHPINRRRRDSGRPTADMVWPWAPGSRMSLPQFALRHGIGGSCVAGSTAPLGLARLVGLRPWRPPGATGGRDSDYRAKARATLDVLKEKPFCMVHIGAPAEAGLEGDWEAKVDSLRMIDERFFGVLLDRIGLIGEFRILVAIDRPVYSDTRSEGSGWTPFLLSGADVRSPQSGIVPFDERALDEATRRIDEGSRLLDLLFGAAD